MSSSDSIIVPVRAGSKGLTHKNIKEFCGKPLLGYIVEKLNNSKLFKNIVVSSDSEDYLEIAKNFGANQLVLRPKRLATDDATSLDVVKHAITWIENKTGKQIDRYYLTQVTSPLWDINDLNGFISESAASTTSVVSVCESKYNPFYNLLTTNNGGFSLFTEKKYTHRQDLPVTYFVNGCFYSFLKHDVFGNGVLKRDRTDIFLMSPLKSLDIDDENDFILAELVARNLLNL